MIKKNIKKFVPPIILDFVRKNKTRGMSFSNYEQALSNGESYEQDDVIDIVVSKGRNYKELIESQSSFELSRFRAIIGLFAAIENNRLNVLDFGGGAGADYYLVKKLLVGSSVTIDWRVVETDAMASKAKEYGLENKELSFFSSITEASKDQCKFDLVLSSCSINYTPKPLDMLKEIMNVNSRYFYFTRTPMSLNKLNSPIILQRSMLSNNGYGPISNEMAIEDKEITYPVTIIYKDDFESIVKMYGEIVLRIDEEKNAYYSSEGAFDLFGYLIEKK